MNLNLFPPVLVLFCSFLSGNFTLAADCDSAVTQGNYPTRGWGLNLRNTRYQSETSINRSNVEGLELLWSFALDEGVSPHSYPLVSTDTVFVGTEEGNLYALDKDSACVRWSFKIDSAIRTAITLGSVQVGDKNKEALFFGTFSGEVYALETAGGELLWRTDVKDHPLSVVTGTPVFHQSKLYVPLSSMEVAVAISPFYGCCTFRGSLVSLDANTGTQKWRRHVVTEPAKVTGTHYIFIEEWGPSGAPIWSTPTIDITRGVIYFGTGENYSAPASKTSDAIFALNIEDGSVRWVEQFTEQDTFNIACSIPGHPNCPSEVGPDLDFGAPPIIAVLDSGKDILIAGQKSGEVYGLNPDTGKLIWQKTLGRGGYLGGVHWGMAVNENLGLLYVPISDVPAGAGEGEPSPGINALNMKTGELRWFTPNPDRCQDRLLCRTGMSAAIVATSELLFAGGLDGWLHAYDAETGEILWTYNTWKDFETTNKVPAHGGAIDVHGPVVAGDMVFVQSGYATFGQQGGNALLAFRLQP